MPEFQVLAYRMLDLYLKSQPEALEWGDWHLPKFQNTDDYMGFASWEVILKIATARSARLSYLTFDNEIDPAKDIELHDRLLASGHMSPFEHCAQASHPYKYPESNFDSPNFRSGWMQYRKQFENENRTNVDLAATLATKPDWITLSR